MEQSDHSQYLQTNQYNKNEELEFFVLKHAAETSKKQPTGPRRMMRPFTYPVTCAGATSYLPEINLFFGKNRDFTAQMPY